MRPKVVLIARWFPPTVGGIERYLEKLYEGLTTHFDVTLVAPRGQTGLPGAKYRVVVAPVSQRWGIGSKWPILTLGLRALRPAWQSDVIVAGHVLTGAIAVVLGFVYRKPTVVHVYGMELTNAKLVRFKSMVLRRATKVVSISTYSTGLLVRMGVKPSRILEIPPGVDTNRFVSRSGGLPSARTTFLTVSRLDPNSRYKGHDVTAQALRKVRDRGYDFEWRVVGSGPDEGRLQEIVADQGLADMTVLLGTVSLDELLEQYRNASAFVMPNRAGANGESEGFGMVFTEAQACGTPVIAGRDGGTASAVADGIGGIRVDGNDVDAVADALIDVLHRPEVWRKMGSTGQDWVRSHHEWDERVASLSNALRGLLVSS